VLVFVGVISMLVVMTWICFVEITLRGAATGG
jgi:hypothetical protein